MSLCVLGLDLATEHLFKRDLEPILLLGMKVRTLWADLFFNSEIVDGKNVSVEIVDISLDFLLESSRNIDIEHIIFSDIG